MTCTTDVTRRLATAAVVAFAVAASALLSTAPARAAFPPADNGDIAYSAPAAGGTVAIYSVDPSGTKPEQLTSGNQDTFPAYSPDGTKIAFVRNGGIWSLSAGRAVELVAKGSEPAWSPDGSTIVYRGSPGLYEVDADGGEPRRLTNGDDWSPDFAPDGERIVFARVVDGASKLWTMNPDGSDQAMLSEAGLYFEPSYSPDGRWIAFALSITEPLPNFIAGPRAYIGMISADGTKILSPAFPGDFADQPAFSPDGSRVGFRSSEGVFNATRVFTSDFNGGAATALTAANDVLFSGVSWGRSPAACAGKEATIAGTSDDDELVGTPKRDVIVAGAGDDAVAGREGRDLICGGPGDDELRGGSAADGLRGGAGGDDLRGGRHVDLCRGGVGSDRRGACER